MNRFARWRPSPAIATVISLIVLFVALGAGRAVAASRAPQPASLALRKSDFPAHTQYSLGDIPSNVIRALKKGFGIQASGVYFGATIPFGSNKSETVSGAVYTTAAADQAKKAYTAFKRRVQRRNDVASAAVRR